MDGSTSTYRLTNYEGLSQTLNDHDLVFQGPDYDFFKDIMLPGRVQN